MIAIKIEIKTYLYKKKKKKKKYIQNLLSNLLRGKSRCIIQIERHRKFILR